MRVKFLLITYGGDTFIKYKEVRFFMSLSNVID